MKHFQKILFSILFVVAWAIGTAGTALAASVDRDFGLAEDRATTSNMYFGSYPTLWTSGGAEYAPSYLGFHDNGSECWWLKQPASLSGYTSARTIKFRGDATLYIKPGALNTSGDLYLTIRYKDDVSPGQYAGAPVFVYNPSAQLIGTIGGQNDHRWKIMTFTIHSNQRQLINNEFKFRIGSHYTDGIVGELPINKVRLSDDGSTAGFPADAQGYWPSINSGNLRFPDIGRNNEYASGQGAFFPFGIYSNKNVITDGGSATQAGTGAMDSFQIMQNAFFNTVVLVGWGDYMWGSGWNLYPSQSPWASPGTYVEMQIDQFLIQAAGHGMKVIPNFLTDTRIYWMNNYGGSVPSLNRIAAVVARLKDNPNILAWNPVDEWDHEDSGYGKPIFYSYELYKACKDNDPNHPVYMTEMAFGGPASWTVGSKAADILANDNYFDDGYAAAGGLTSLEVGAATAAQHLDDGRHALGNTKAILFVPHFGEGANQLRNYNGVYRLPNASEVVFQGYLGITHGAQGLLYFAFIHPQQPDYYQYSSRVGSTLNYILDSNGNKISAGLDLAWQGMRQMGDELFGDQGIASALIAPSTQTDIMGEKGVVTCSNPKVHHTLRRMPNGVQYLITVNMSETPQTATFNIGGGITIPAQVPVRFESRQVNSSGASFSDTFQRFERHVYMVGLSSFDTTPPSTPTGFSAVAVSRTQANLSWTVSTDNVGISGYRIYRNGAQIGTSPITSYSDTSLSAGTQYSYKAAAYDTSGNVSGQSSAVQITTVADIAPVLEAIGAKNVAWGSTLTFTINAADAENDPLTYSATNLPTGATFNALTKVFSWTPGSAQSGVFNVTFSVTDGTFSDSEAVVITSVYDSTPPSVPAGLSGAGASSIRINLVWTASTDNVGVAGYQIYRDGMKIGSSTTASYSDSGLAPLTQYSYTITAYDAVKNISAQSAPAQATTLALSGTSKSGTITASETWSGNIVITGDVRINSGRVTVAAGSTVTFGAGSQIYVNGSNGSLDFEGTASNPIYIVGGSGKSIGSYQGQVIMRFCRIDNCKIGSNSSLVSPGLIFEDNVLVNGSGDSSVGCWYSPSVIRRNYIHSPLANNFRVLARAEVGSDISDNIIYGGSWPAANIGGTVQRNIFISLVIPSGGRVDDYTHEQILGLLDGTIMERNLFIGKSYGAIMGIGSTNAANAVIKNNTIDMRGSGEGVTIHMASPQPYGINVRNNIFMRAGNSINDDQSNQIDVFQYLDYNLYASVSNRYRNILITGKNPGDAGYDMHALPVSGTLLPGDVVVNPELGYPFPYSDSDMLSGVRTYAEAMNFYQTAYALKAGSPAINAGDPQDSATVSDGQCDMGAFEYSGTILDVTPPTGSANINSGASYTKSPSSILTLLAQDISGVLQMKLSDRNDNFSSLTALAFSSPYPWNLLGSDGLKIVYAWFADTVGNWMPTPVSDTITLDTLAPAVSNVATTNISNNSALITFTSSEPTVDYLNYGLSVSYTSQTTEETVYGTSHSIVLSSLSASTTYNYQIVITDRASNQSQSVNYTFKTLAAALPDTTAPATVSNLSAGSITSNSTILSWTAPGDDANVGIASNYDIRYSTTNPGSNISTWWTSAAQISGEPAPHLAGTAETLIITGLSPSTQYYFALKTNDEVPNTSAISNLPSFTTTAAPIVLPPPTPSGGGGSSGGGGGGGGGGASTPATPAVNVSPSNFVALGANNQILLSWQNPLTSNFAKVKLYRKLGSYPSSETDANAKLIYEGINQQFIDTNLENNQTYFYHLYSYDRNSIRSNPLSAYAKTDASKETVAMPKTESLFLNKEGTGAVAGDTPPSQGGAGGGSGQTKRSLIGVKSAEVDQITRTESVQLKAQARSVNLSAITKKIYDKIILLAEKTPTQDNRYNLASFIHNGTPTTIINGAGERGGSIASFRSAFNRLPESETDWQDVIKIANGRWPTQRNLTAEMRAQSDVFVKIYGRTANLKNQNDNAAVTVITYGLRPALRNTESEKAAIRSFRYIFNSAPASALDWDVVRAIAYSGAKR